jgi:integrase
MAGDSDVVKQVKRRGFPTKAAAQAELDEVKSNVRSGAYVAPSKQTVGEFLDEWLATIKPTIRPGSHASYEAMIRLHVTPRIGDVRLQALDGGQLNYLFAQLLAPGANRKQRDVGLSPRSVAYTATILKRALSDAMRWGRLARNPMAGADPPVAAATGGRGQLRTWNADQVRTFLAHSAKVGERDTPLWRLLVSTGIRRGEALGLRWADVDLAAKTATITQTVIVVNQQVVFGTPKSSAGERTLELDDATVAALKAHRRRQLEERIAVGRGWRDHDLVFPNVDGAPMHPNSVTGRFNRQAARRGLPHISLHGLRHTWATLALRAGVHPKVVQEVLGHSLIGITLGTYSHVTEGLGREATEQVAALFAESS